MGDKDATLYILDQLKIELKKADSISNAQVSVQHEIHKNWRGENFLTGWINVTLDVMIFKNKKEEDGTS